MCMYVCMNVIINQKNGTLQHLNHVKNFWLNNHLKYLSEEHKTKRKIQVKGVG